MAYTPTAWKKDDVITSEKLNKLENGVATAEEEAEKKPAWGDVTGKPSTFAPTIGTTAATALAGNTTIPTVPSVMSQAEATAGTATTARTITAKVLSDLIDEKIAAAAK